MKITVVVVVDGEDARGKKGRNCKKYMVRMRPDKKKSMMVRTRDEKNAY